MQNKTENAPVAWQMNCPVSLPANADCVTLAHGEGGRLSRKLVQERIVRVLKNEYLVALNDAAQLPEIRGPVALTTDSFVVSPLFFPGGDIGSLAVFGTVNDLAVSGAKPLWLTLSLIMEEGLPLVILDRILESIAKAAEATNVKIVAGDTKVVPRGAADGLFINTAGVGELISPIPPGPATLQEQDELIVSGPIGRHGIAVLAVREELGLEPQPRSDCGSLLRPVQCLRNEMGDQIRCLRDATRGGVAAVLHEWAEACELTLSIDERSIPVSPDVRGVCELLGLDALHVANEGTMVIAVKQGAAAAALKVLHSLPETAGALLIGTVTPRGIAPVTVRRTLGPEQPLDDPLGSPLPRIC
ncbi:hydrogenase expression/formation protein HypE [uncultured Gimesia sp.]|jgi:hydrogenase expression/formation protein HypE|uniref:hydrogenase expression/formation protein HypE n=1 Tax=uncultured Gimesia sp. TaxID=1678688 RepID=UPI0026127E61|nr:hydrogenase expression/formation protein HypE [uncultured Gimesia sp.]